MKSLVFIFPHFSTVSVTKVYKETNKKKHKMNLMVVQVEVKSPKDLYEASTYYYPLTGIKPIKIYLIYVQFKHIHKPLIYNPVVYYTTA